MQIIISPAKQMHIDNDAFAPTGIAPFPDKTARLIEELGRIEAVEGPQGLQKLWNVSDRLLAETLDTLYRMRPVLRPEDLARPDVSANVAPAVLAYHGIQYQHMAPAVMDGEALSWLQDHLWIISGLYGCLRPFDAVQPYRLEMGTKLAIDHAKNLYGYWGGSLGEAIGQASKTVLNLASVEYAKAVLPHLPAGTKIVTCIFAEELRNGKPRQLSTASKAARGTLVRWLAQHGDDDLSDLELFDVGYALDRDLSHVSADGNTHTVVFMKQ